MTTLHEVVALLELSHRSTQKAIRIANGYLTNLKILGETPEEREQTLMAFKDLSPPELREAITQYHERRALLTYLEEGPKPKEDLVA